MTKVASHINGSIVPIPLPSSTGSVISVIHLADNDIFTCLPAQSSHTPLEGKFMVCLYTHLPGRLLADIQPQTDEVLESLGRSLATLDAALMKISESDKGLVQRLNPQQDYPWGFNNALSFVRGSIANVHSMPAESRVAAEETQPQAVSNARFEPLVTDQFNLFALPQIDKYLRPLLASPPNPSVTSSGCGPAISNERLSVNLPVRPTTQDDPAFIQPILAKAMDASRGPKRSTVIRDLFTRVARRLTSQRIDSLRTCIIHGDANDRNILVGQWKTPTELPTLYPVGSANVPSSYEEARHGGTHSSPSVHLVDFGDVQTGPLVADLAIACAYAMINKASPLEAMANVVRGYTRELPLHSHECEVVFDLAVLRLLVSACQAIRNLEKDPSNEAYINISQDGVWSTLSWIWAHVDDHADVSRLLCRVAGVSEEPIFGAVDFVHSTPSLGYSSELKTLPARDAASIEALMHMSRLPPPSMSDLYEVDLRVNLNGVETQLTGAFANQETAADFEKTSSKLGVNANRMQPATSASRLQAPVSLRQTSSASVASGVSATSVHHHQRAQSQKSKNVHTAVAKPGQLPSAPSVVRTPSGAHAVSFCADCSQESRVAVTGYLTPLPPLLAPCPRPVRQGGVFRDGMLWAKLRTRQLGVMAFPLQKRVDSLVVAETDILDYANRHFANAKERFANPVVAPLDMTLMQVWVPRREISAQFGLDVQAELPQSIPLLNGVKLTAPRETRDHICSVDIQSFLSLSPSERQTVVGRLAEHQTLPCLAVFEVAHSVSSPTADLIFVGGLDLGSVLQSCVSSTVSQFASAPVPRLQPIGHLAAVPWSPHDLRGVRPYDGDASPALVPHLEVQLRVRVRRDMITCMKDTLCLPVSIPRATECHDSAVADSEIAASPDPTPLILEMTRLWRPRGDQGIVLHGATDAPRPLLHSQSGVPPHVRAPSAASQTMEQGPSPVPVTQTVSSSRVAASSGAGPTRRRPSIENLTDTTTPAVGVTAAGGVRAVHVHPHSPPAAPLNVDSAALEALLQSCPPADCYNEEDVRMCECYGDGSLAANLKASREMVARVRGTVTPYCCTVAYKARNPMNVAFGFGAYMFDERGSVCLDAVNNVANVGHGNPLVARAIASQAGMVNTNSRYLYPQLGLIADQIRKTLPPKLSRVFIVCTGTEANELAVRLARTYTRRWRLACMDGAYHGNSNTIIQVSPYKHHAAGGLGTSPSVLRLPLPDTLRGPYKVVSLPLTKGRKPSARLERASTVAGSGPERSDIFMECLTKYGIDAANMVREFGGLDAQNARAGKYRRSSPGYLPVGVSHGSQNPPTGQEEPELSEEGVAAFIHETMICCGGVHYLHPTWRAQVYRAVREQGGVCIADEVQSGMGRMGNRWWCCGPRGQKNSAAGAEWGQMFDFDRQEGSGQLVEDATPDILTMGKPLGNGMCIAAVACTEEIAASFGPLDYFNTYGGSAVQCVAALAAFRCIDDWNLMDRTERAGHRLYERLESLAASRKEGPFIAHVRGGEGLMAGVELVKDLETLTPATEEARLVNERLRDMGVLLTRDGMFDNVLKIKPPLLWTAAEVDIFISALAVAMDDTQVRDEALKPWAGIARRVATVWDPCYPLCGQRPLSHEGGLSAHLAAVETLSPEQKRMMAASLDFAKKQGGFPDCCRVGGVDSANVHAAANVIRNSVLADSRPVSRPTSRVNSRAPSRASSVGRKEVDGKLSDSPSKLPPGPKSPPRMQPGAQVLQAATKLGHK